MQGTELERASAATIRVRRLKIGAAIVRNTRQVRIIRYATSTRMLPAPWLRSAEKVLFRHAIRQRE